MERALEVCLLGAVAWPLLRLCANRAFQRKLRAFPRVNVAIVALLAIYSLVIAGLALYFPLQLRLLAILSCCGIVFARWRSRPVYGHSRGLPPGSLALVPLDPWLDHLFYQKQAARYGPIFKVSHFVEPMVCVVGFQRALELFRRYDDVLIVPPLPFSRVIRGGFLRYMDTASHEVYRSVFRTALTGDVIQHNEPFIGSTVRCGILRMAESSSRTRATGVHPQHDLDEMLFAVFARVFFGIVPEAKEFVRLRTLYRAIDFRVLSRASFRSVRGGLDELRAMLQQQIHHSSNMPPCFLANILRSDPKAARDPTLLENLIYMLQTSSSDVAGLLHWIIKMLCDHPVWVQRLREESQESAQRPNSLADRILLETLRLEQSEYLVRRVIEKIEFGGFVIPKGWLLRICVRESHRDPKVFENPDVFDPDRFLGRPYSRTEYSPFGASKISCLGEHFTKTVGRIFVNELNRGFDLEVVGDGPREYGGFHWRPSRKFRVRLTKRVTVSAT